MSNEKQKSTENMLYYLREVTKLVQKSWNEEKKKIKAHIRTQRKKEKKKERKRVMDR